MFETIQSYYIQCKTEASKLFEMAKQYVTAEKPNAAKAYCWKCPDGAVINVTGDAKTLAIEHITLTNRETQYKRLNRIVSTVLGGIVYHYGWWKHNPLLSLMVIPLAMYAHNNVNRAITMHFQGGKDQLKAAIERNLLKTR